MSRRWPRPAVAVAAGGLAAAAGVAVASAPGLLAAARLLVAVVLATGAWFSVRRVGAVDLGTAGAVAAGAYGAVAVTLAGLPAVAGLAAGGLTGGAVGAAVGGVGGRVGRTLGALSSLALGLAVVSGLAAWPAGGGQAGFHAVPLLTPSERGDVAVLVPVAVAVVAVVWSLSRSRVAAAAAVAVCAPALAASLGRRAALDAAAAGAVAGVALGVGGAAGAAVAGSVLPAAYGLELAAVLALAALVGGGHPLAGALGGVAVLGPGIVAPAAPLMGDVPLLVAGVAGLALLAVRPTGLVAGHQHHAAGGSPARPTPRRGGLQLTVDGTRLPDGRAVHLRVDPGELVAVAGPNGAGKSTLLARVGGQLPDDGTVAIAGAAAPRGAVARARLGVARTWQHPPAVGPDAARIASRGADDTAAAAWAAEVLADDASGPAGADLVRLAARRPGLALLDEPAAHLPVGPVVTLLRGLAQGGAAVLVAEHREDLLAQVDRVVRIGSSGTAERARP